jgi:hypothetical protein
MVEVIVGRKYKIKREGWQNVVFTIEVLGKEKVGDVVHYRVKITEPGLAAGTIWLEKEEILDADPIVGGGRRKTHRKGRKTHRKARKTHRKH